MKKYTKSRIWDLGLLIAGIILPPLLAQFWGVVKADLRIPAWAILSYALTVAVLIYFLRNSLAVNTQEQREEHAAEISALENELKNDFETNARYSSDQIEVLRSELQSSDEACARLSRQVDEMQRIRFNEGLYYHKSDDGKTQPFCRVCRDLDGALVTVEVSGGEYWCPRCQSTHNVSVGISKITEDEEIPF